MGNAHSNSGCSKDNVTSCGSAPAKKPCCVCKETKRVRDECIVLNGEEKCLQFIDAHNRCLRDEGFEVKQ